MALNVDLAAGDVLVFPAGAAARVQVLVKSGHRTRVAIESDSRVQIVRAAMTRAQKLPTTRGCEHGKYAV